MANDYWAGALPGLLMATILSLATLRLLGPNRIRHILWLVPGLHFFGAFAAGPALSLAYSRIAVPAAGAAAPLVWAAVLLAAGALLATAAWRSGGDARTYAASAWLGTFGVAALMVPAAHVIIAGR